MKKCQNLIILMCIGCFILIVASCEDDPTLQSEIDQTSLPNSPVKDPLSNNLAEPINSSIWLLTDDEIEKGIESEDLDEQAPVDDINGKDEEDGESEDTSDDEDNESEDGTEETNSDSETIESNDSNKTNESQIDDSEYIDSEEDSIGADNENTDDADDADVDDDEDLETEDSLEEEAAPVEDEENDSADDQGLTEDNEEVENEELPQINCTQENEKGECVPKLGYFYTMTNNTSNDEVPMANKYKINEFVTFNFSGRDFGINDCGDDLDSLLKHIKFVIKRDGNILYESSTFVKGHCFNPYVKAIIANAEISDSELTAGMAEIVIVNTVGQESKPTQICIVNDWEDNCNETKVCEEEKSYSGTFSNDDNTCSGTMTLSIGKNPIQIFTEGITSTDVYSVKMDITMTPNLEATCDGFALIDMTANGWFQHSSNQKTKGNFNLSPHSPSMPMTGLMVNVYTDTELAELYGDWMSFKLNTPKICGESITGSFTGSNETGTVELTAVN